MGKIKKAFERVKSIKNIEVIIAVIICVIIVILFISGLNGGEKKSSEIPSTFYEYNLQLENKLSNVISSIKGCGNAAVAITYESGTEKVYAYETQIQTSGGVTTEKQEIITVQGQPLVIKELSPNILGVVVVASGADNPVVRMQINEVVVTLLGIDGSKVQVFTYKS